LFNFGLGLGCDSDNVAHIALINPHVGHVGYSTLWSTLPLEMKAAVGIKYKRVLGRDVQGGGNIATVHTIDYHASVRV